MIFSSDRGSIREQGTRLVIPSAARLSSRAERGIAIRPVEGRTGDWLLELVVGYCDWLLRTGPAARSLCRLPSALSPLLSAVCRSLPSALLSGPSTSQPAIPRLSARNDKGSG